MKFPGVKRRPPFVTLPRHKRSHEVILTSQGWEAKGLD